jgi:RNA polymerase sigma-70 factor (ECF subfamily)
MDHGSATNPDGMEAPLSFAAVYAQHRAGVYGTAMRVLGRPCEAEDVTQEVFVKFWRSPERFDPSRGELGSYLRMMARSRALDLVRHEQASTRASDRLQAVSTREEMSHEELPPEAIERDEQRKLLHAALRRLPVEQREALVLAYWGGMSAREVAEAAGVPFGTARSRMRLGLEKLRDRVELREAELEAAGA